MKLPWVCILVALPLVHPDPKSLLQHSVPGRLLNSQSDCFLRLAPLPCFRRVIASRSGAYLLQALFWATCEHVPVSLKLRIAMSMPKTGLMYTMSLFVYDKMRRQVKPLWTL